MCSIKHFEKRRRELTAIAGLLLLTLGEIAAQDIPAGQRAIRKSTDLEKIDAKAGPISRVRRQRSSGNRFDRIFSSAEWSFQKAKLPWEPNAPGG